MDGIICQSAPEIKNVRLKIIWQDKTEGFAHECYCTSCFPYAALKWFENRTDGKVKMNVSMSREAAQGGNSQNISAWYS